MWTLQSLSNFDDDGAHPVPYLQLVYPVVIVLLGPLASSWKFCKVPEGGLGLGLTQTETITTCREISSLN